MTRRNLVILFVLLGAAFILWQNTLRKSKEQAPAPLSQEPEATSSQRRQQSQNSVAGSAGKPGRETAVAEMPPREVPPARVQARGTITDTHNAQLAESALFAETSWKVWAGVTAVLKKDGRPQKNVKGEVNGYYLVEDGVAGSAVQFSASRPLVVIDTRLDTVGVLTGIFTVVLKSGVTADVLAQIPEIKIVNEFPQINTYYVTASKEPFDLLALKEFLRSEPGVAEVQPEILSRQYEKY
ncbi:MAG: hypothetical protein HUU57_16900 [Bdellovibrio sp.]|nr:hypothetical protein [Bdellovibrio sp.]